MAKNQKSYTPEFKHPPDNRRGFLVDNQLVLIVRMPQVAVGVECAKVFTASCFGMERGLDFCGNILGVHIV